MIKNKYSDKRRSLLKGLLKQMSQFGLILINKYHQFTVHVNSTTSTQTTNSKPKTTQKINVYHFLSSQNKSLSSSKTQRTKMLLVLSSKITTWIHKCTINTPQKLAPNTLKKEFLIYFSVLPSTNQELSSRSYGCLLARGSGLGSLRMRSGCK